MVQQTLSIYLGCYAFAQLIFGPLSDAKGRLFALYTGLFIYILTSIATIFASSGFALLCLRAAQGFGGAAVAVTLSALIRDRYKKNEASKMMSMVMVMMAIAPMIAPIIGGYILVLANWHSIFGFLALLGLLVSLLIYLYIPETLPPEKRQPVQLSKLVGKYAQIVVHREAMANIMLSSFAFASMMTFVTGSPYVYIEYFGLDESLYGYLFGINVIGMMLASSVNARFVERYGAERMLLLGIILISSGTLLLGYFTLFPPTQIWQLLPAVALSTSSIGLITGNCMVITMDRFPQAAGTAAALAGSIRFGLGATTGVVLSQLHNETTLPLTGVMTISGLIAVVIYVAYQVSNRRQVDSLSAH